jgi:hypothetical protein
MELVAKRLDVDLAVWQDDVNEAMFAGDGVYVLTVFWKG